MSLPWNEQLQQLLIKKLGNKQGQLLSKKYARAFPPSYCSDYPPETAFHDILRIETLSKEMPITTHLYEEPQQTSYPLHFRLYQWQKPAPLSDILPMLENLDLRTNNEVQDKITLSDDQTIWISDFSLAYQQNKLDLETVKPLFQEAFTHILFGLCENDGFNKLILGAALSWRDIIILRAYSKYLHQTRFRFSQAYIEKALAANTPITKNLVALFMTLHHPATQATAKMKAAQIEQQIQRALESVTSLDEDRIFRRLLALIKATLRTNFFQSDANGKPKAYLSLKLDSAAVPELPLPVPLVDTFVYSPRFEAIHLRNTKVARGGIRWSDRREDFRTEVLGLMKAQKVKNSIIIPSGAKGGFVLKIPTTQADVVQCYKSFIRGLLDITDNIVNKKIVRPKNTVCYDDADTYLVVAADKGTASFSDIANSISAEYDFWLGDAFASGGSTGYDHKKIGITARGAWESIKRHFHELDIDIAKTPITVCGIGDMSGDVFGNGMIYSNRIQLVAAFDHRDIFIDPTPDAERTYAERVRLFNLPTSSWQDFNASLISKGGGVFKRSLKSIPISKQMKEVLQIEESTLTPNELIRAILKAPVDLLYNGGIGTYVKASSENQLDVGDRTNDYCRVNGGELRARVVGEGGNLGFTQLGRIEYALNGGLINTDFIDNSGGVDCSDHEVNLKILLDSEVRKKAITYPKRNHILASATQEVADLVLEDNYRQALVMSFSAHHAKRNLGLHQNYIKELEAQGVLNRKVEFLPDDKTLNERKALGIGLTRPELAVLLAYSKIHLKNEILKSKLTDDPYFIKIIETAFPVSTRKKFHQEMDDHILHKNIIATQLSNHLINQMGFTFIYRLQIETGSAVEDIIRAYTISSAIFSTNYLQQAIEALNFSIPLNDQYDMLFNIRNLINLSTRWFLRSKHLKEDINELIKHYGSRIKILESSIPKLMSGKTQDYLQNLVTKFQQKGLPVALAKQIGAYRAMYTTLNIIDVATKHHFDLNKTAQVYFTAGEHMNLVWFRDQIAADSRDGHWNILARLTLRDELDICQRAFTVAVMKKDKKELSSMKLIQSWISNNQTALLHWNKLLELMHDSAQVEYTMFFIAMRELLGLILASQ